MKRLAVPARVEPGTSAPGLERPSTARLASPYGRIGFAVNLAFAMTAATCGSHAIGALAVLIRDDVGISRSQVGYLATSYLAAGAMFSPILGVRMSRLGSRVALLVLYVYAAISFVLIAGSPEYWLLIGAAAIAGIASATSNPLTNFAILEHTAPGRRGTILGVKQSGVQLGVFLAGATLPTIGVWFSWRVAVLSLAVVPIIGIVLTLWLVPNTRGAVGLTQARPRMRAVASAHPMLLWMAAYAVVMGAALSAVSVYLPLYAFENLSFSVRVAGLAGSMVGLIGVPSRIAWGRAAETRGSHVPRDLFGISVGAAVMATLVVTAPWIGGWALWVGALGLGGIGNGWNVVAMMAVIRDVPGDMSTAGTGVIQFGFYLGLLAGPTAFGIIIGATDSYASAWWMVVTLCSLGAAIIAVWVRHGRTGLDEHPTPMEI